MAFSHDDFLGYRIYQQLDSWTTRLHTFSAEI